MEKKKRKSREVRSSWLLMKPPFLSATIPEPSHLFPAVHGGEIQMTRNQTQNFLINVLGKSN